MSRPRTPNARVLAQEIQEDLRFQVRSWRAQRIGWVAGGALLLAGAIGLFGRGPLSSALVDSGDGRLSVVFERLARHGVPAQIEVHVAPESIDDETVTVWFDREYLDGLELKAIVPKPSAVRDGDGRTAYEFDVASVGQDGFDLTLQVEHDDIGPRGGEISIGGGPPVRIDQLVYP